MTECSVCGVENLPGHKFCSNCGSPLQTVCPNCQAENDPGNRFCFNCGTGLQTLPEADNPGTEGPPTQPQGEKTERRFVSVLFADLVGFTTFSEHRDPEDVREMLTLYFDRCREIIERYGGEVDKFIGDAVMGVWGAIESHEDDAERATRAAMDLVEMVALLGEEIDVPELAARAGVMSGETAVGPGGNEKGLVVGDLVNTASRLQSIAPPGGVLIGTSTAGLVSERIDLAPAGDHEVKGKEEAVTAYRPTSVMTESDRQSGESGIEGPFVGRDDELRVLKDQLHAVGREGKSRLVSIVGEGGIGKTRLAKELLRYIDGIADDIYYHRGRSPSYGDGVTFWALGEMVRQRARIAEGDDSPKARLRLRTMVAEYVQKEDEQRWIEPRLAALIGLTEMPSGDRSELFSALRTFFQRIAERGTVLMVFEDLHWADDGLIDFVDELVERSNHHPILVVTLARPELLERRSDWGVARKRTLSMHLSRLEQEPMHELVAGLAPGLPPSMVERIAERSAGVPLYAVEFIRMLVNGDQLVRVGSGYEFRGSDSELTVPDSLSAIIGARLDKLSSTEQGLIQDASVLGYSFSGSALAAQRDEGIESIEPILRDLVRDELLEFDEDPRSPERGQYRFVQGLIKEVAYGRMNRAEKVARHLAIAADLESVGDPEFAGIVAGHYAFAAEADPANAELVGKAGRALSGAAERAASLHSYEQAASLYNQVIGLANEDAQVASNQVLYSRYADLAGLPDADRVVREALAWYEGENDEDGVVAATTELVYQLAGRFRSTEAVDIALPVFQSTPRRVTVEWAKLANATSRALMLANRLEEAVSIADEVLIATEELGEIALGIDALINKGTALANSRHWLEGTAILRGAGEMARVHELLGLVARAANNVGATAAADDQRSLIPDSYLETLERLGDKDLLVRARFFGGLSFIGHGRYDEAIALATVEDERETSSFWLDWFQYARGRAELLRDGFDQGRLDDARSVLIKYESTDDPQLFDAIREAQLAIAFDAREYDRVVELAVEGSGSTFYRYPMDVEIGLAAAAWTGRTDDLAVLASRLEGAPKGRATSGLVLFAEALGYALAGRLDEATSPYREARALWEEAGAPATLAIFQAVLAKASGPETSLGAEAGMAAYLWFSATQSQLYLDLFAEVFPVGTENVADLAG
ncbi:MAG: AAA family ATPase [Actinomycetia bacterium]|nr:AAA family ATPase [Actinomycetes bacterium]